MRRNVDDRTGAFRRPYAAFVLLKGNLRGQIGISRERQNSGSSCLFVDGGIAGRARSVQPWLIPSLPVDQDTLQSHIRLSAASASLAFELLPDASGAPVEKWVIPAPQFDVEHHIEGPIGNPTRAGMASVVGDAVIHEQSS